MVTKKSSFSGNKDIRTGTAGNNQNHPQKQGVAETSMEHHSEESDWSNCTHSELSTPGQERKKKSLQLRAGHYSHMQLVSKD